MRPTARAPCSRSRPRSAGSRRCRRCSSRPRRARLHEGRAGQALRPERRRSSTWPKTVGDGARSCRPVSSSSAAGTPPARPRVAGLDVRSAASRRRRRSTSRRRPHAPARRVDQARAEPGTARREGASRHPALGLPLAERLHARRAGAGGARRHRARHLPARRAKRYAGTAAEDAALRPLGRGDDRRDVPRDPAGHAPGRAGQPHGCGSFSSRRCTRARTTRTSGSSSPNLERGAGRARARDRARGRRPRAAAASRHLGLVRDAGRTARRFRPDVVYAHFLVPAGLLRARSATRAPARRHGARPGRREHRLDAAARPPATRVTSFGVPRRSSRSRTGCARGSRRRCRRRAGKTEVIDCGVDLERFAPRDAEAARAELGWRADGTAFLCARLAERAQERRSGSRARSSGAARARCPSSATARSAPRSRAGAASARRPRRPTTRCRAGSRPPTSSASRASSSRSAWRRSRRMASARSGRRDDASAARPSS